MNHNLEQGIKELLDAWGDYVVVSLVDKSECRNIQDNKETSRATRGDYSGSKITCTIVHPETQEEIDAAARAIVLAEQYAGELELERNHEMNNPNWWKSLKAKLQYNKL